MGQNENKKEIPILKKQNCLSYNIDQASDTMGGCREKGCYRVSAELLSGLLADIKNNTNSSYVTHCNDLVKKEKFDPKYVSSIVKRTDVDGGLREMICSRMMNYFEAPTSYEKLFKIDKDDSFGFFDSQYVTLSVDTIPYENDMVTLADLGIKLDLDLERDIPNIEKALEKIFVKKKYLAPFSKVISRKDFDAQKESIIKQYVYAFLIRKFILKDSDFHAGNSAIILDPKTLNMQSFVSFDYEDTLVTKFRTDLYAYEQIKYALFMYPGVFKKFRNKLENMLEIDQDKQNSNLMESLLDELPAETGSENIEIINQMYYNASNVSSLCEKIIKDIFLTRANYEGLGY